MLRSRTTVLEQGSLAAVTICKAYRVIFVVSFRNFPWRAVLTEDVFRVEKVTAPGLGYSEGF